MSYRLKKNVQSFTVVEGPLADRSYRHGVAYEEVPANEAVKFDKIEPAAATDSPAARTARKTAENGGRKEELK